MNFVVLLLLEPRSGAEFGSGISKPGVGADHNKAQHRNTLIYWPHCPGQRNLKFLRLNSNNLTNLDSGAIDFGQSLELLDLAHNKSAPFLLLFLSLCPDFLQYFTVNDGNP